MNDVKSFRKLLMEMKESGQPIPVIRLIGGEVLHNLVVINVGFNYVEFKDPNVENAMFIPTSKLLTVGTF